MSSSIIFSSKGDFSKTTSFLEKMKEPFGKGILNKYGEMGVRALSAATPKDTGLAASSWYYTIEQRSSKNGKSASINFNNSDIENGCPVAILIQYGHATKNGGWVEGTDYINPAMRPIFDKIASDAWKEVSSIK